MPAKKLVTPSKKDEIYRSFFNRLKRTKRINFLGWILYLPIVGVASIVLEKVFGKSGMILAIVWLFCLLAYGSWMLSFVCPRCKKKYFVLDQFPYKKPFTEKCVNCSLGQPYNDEVF